MTAIFSNEYVLGGAFIGALIAAGYIWRRTRGWWGDDDKDA